MIAVFAMCLCLASILEYKLFKTIYLPVSLIFWPILIVVLFALFCGEDFGFYPFDSNQVVPFVLGLIAVFIGEILAACIRNSIDRREDSTNLSVESSPNESLMSDDIEINPKSIRIIVLIMLSIGAVRLVYLIFVNGLANYLASDGLDAELLRGPIAHLILIGYALCPMLLKNYFEAKSKKDLAVWLCYVALMFFTMVKYHSIFLVIASFIYCIITKAVRLQKLLPALLFIPVIIFMINYVVNFAARGTIAQNGYLTNHLINYLIGGILYTSVTPASMMGSNLTPLNLLTAQIMTIPNMIYNSICGTSVFSISSIPYIVLGTNGQTGNVCNLITLNFSGGSYISGFFCLFLQSIVWTFCIYKAKIKTLSAYVAAALVLAFFGNYFTLSPIWEIFILSIFFTVIYKKIPTRIKEKDDAR